MQPKILIIGSRDHNRGKCIDWLEPFPNIEEYDSIIINLQSLTQEVYDENISNISQMRQSIETVFVTDREIFCIMNKIVFPTPPPFIIGPKAKNPNYVPPTNYDWFPFSIDISDRKKGERIFVINHRFDKYFQYVDQWNLVVSGAFKKPIDLLKPLICDFAPIAENLSKKMIGATLKYKESSKANRNGKIHLLPPPTKCDNHQAIEILLDIIYGKQDKVIPSWRKDIEIPEIGKFEQEIEKKNNEIKGIQQEIFQLTTQMQEWDSYRDLLSTTGDDLENIVQKTLSDIGIKTKKAKKVFMLI